MFERYGESARRAIIVARYEAGQSNSGSIETHHLLLGLLENPDTAQSLSISEEQIRVLRERLAAEHAQAVVSGPIDLSPETRRVLAHAAEECANFNGDLIEPEHLILGLLRVEGSRGAQILNEHGVAIGAFRSRCRPSSPVQAAPPAPAPADLHRMLDELPEDRHEAVAAILQALSQETFNVTVSQPEGQRTFRRSAPQPETDPRYSGPARRALHTARAEASRLGAAAVETEHVLLGVLQENGELAVRLLGSPLEIEAIRAEVFARVPSSKKRMTAVDFPFSAESVRALAFAAQAAQLLGQPQIDAAHLVVGLLRVEDSFAAKLLGKRHVSLAVAWQRLTPPA